MSEETESLLVVIEIIIWIWFWIAFSVLLIGSLEG